MADTIILKGKVIITGKLRTKTGLHIGGAAGGLDIGGITNPILRHPVSKEPYIPGSSLRGKMRCLLERQMGKPLTKLIQDVRIHECEDPNDYQECPICHIFGLTPDIVRKDKDKTEAWLAKIKPTRLFVRDAELHKSDDDGLKKLKDAKLDLPYAEIKTEVAIDRITSAAVPRQNERVPADTVFGPFEFIYNLYDVNGTGVAADVAWLKHVFKAMELLEDDYLGGYGSRGTGKIAFEDVTLTLRSQAYYAGEEEASDLTQKHNEQPVPLRGINYDDLQTTIAVALA
ncbi:MAG: type III-A CRISPR-associated RAMP protein Csm3 [Acidobacteria bacterium]|nr:type III-A CRISPR-associated RAMP protein Csm3 [Acidobacteriota bacterium]